MKPALTAFLMAGLTAGGPAPAQEASERDPTLWPPALRQSVAAARAASGPSGEPAGAAPIRQLMRQGGQVYVIAQGRRYGVGDLLDGARIQKIDEQAVWLLDADRLRREALYAGVEKRASTPIPAPIPAPAAARTKNSKETP